MRFIVLFVVTVLSVCTSAAQVGFLKNVNVDLWDGISFPTLKCVNAKSKVGWSLGASFRYEFEGKPWDCGVFIQLDQAKRRINGERSNCETASFGLLTSCNFMKGKDVIPYFSVGLGAGYNKSNACGDLVANSKWAAVVIPKVGVELWRWARVSAYFQLSRKYFNTYGISLGITFGKW